MSSLLSRWWVRWIVAPVLLVVVIHASRTLYLKRQFDARVQALRDAGMPVRFAELEPPAVPEDQNAAPLLAEADAWYEKHLEAGEELATYDELGEIDPQRLALLWLARSDPYVEILARAAARPALRQDLDWSAGHLMEVPTGPQMQRATCFVEQRVRHAERATPGKLRELAIVLDLATRMERFCVIQVLARWTTQDVAAQALEVLSRKPGFDSGAARELLDARFAASEDAELLVEALQGERALLLDFARRWIDGEGPVRMLVEVDNLGTPDEGTTPPRSITDAILGSWLGRPLAYQDALRVLDLMERALALPSLGPHDVLQAATELQDEYRTSYLNLVSHLFAVVPTKAMQERLRHLAQMRVTRVGLALLELREASGAWPESLDAVVPLIGAETIVDPYTDEPLQYEPGVRVAAAAPISDERVRDLYEIAWRFS